MSHYVNLLEVWRRKTCQIITIVILNVVKKNPKRCKKFEAYPIHPPSLVATAAKKNDFFCTFTLKNYFHRGYSIEVNATGYSFRDQMFKPSRYLWTPNTLPLRLPTNSKEAFICGMPHRVWTCHNPGQGKVIITAIQNSFNSPVKPLH